MGEQHSGAVRPSALEQEVYDKNLSAFRYTEIPSGMKQRLDYGARTDGQPDYIGYAPSGLAEGTNGWVLWKFTYDGSGFMTAKDIYGAVEADNANWTDRATYTFD